MVVHYLHLGRPRVLCTIRSSYVVYSLLLAAFDIITLNSNILL